MSRYRTKVMKYNVRKMTAATTSSGTTSQQKSSTSKKDKDKNEDLPQVVINPRKAFGAAIDSIWLELAASDISKGALVDPPEGADPLDEINDRISDNIRQQRLLTEALQESKKLKAKKMSRQLNQKGSKLRSGKYFLHYFNILL
jgi:hypothetical protein